MGKRKASRPCSRQWEGFYGAEPLTWWALKRVTEYSGRVNFWLAGGFGLVYALYVAAEDQWPLK